MLEMITEDSFVTIPEMSLKTGVATRTIKRDIENLQSSGILTRKGGRKDGEWIVTELGMAMLEALKK
ncbi:DeoR family transcriptional regulator [Xylanibacter brevis]|uniref:DeoR family transcriptional regulator n=1 Tax=Xylanibacter brevis TaxID=83231 RepID=UPI0024A7B63E|nr:DeoR family transcriptional regulator [Xylanibacter brevis]